MQLSQKDRILFVEKISVRNFLEAERDRSQFGSPDATLLPRAFLFSAALLVSLDCTFAPPIFFSCVFTVFVSTPRGWRSPCMQIYFLSSRKASACVRRMQQESLLLSARNLHFSTYLRWRRAFLGSPSSVVLTAVQRFSEFR